MYLTHGDLNNYYVIDIETNGLKPDKVWCVVIKNIGTKEIWRFHGDTLAALQEFMRVRERAVWVGHNALSFDFPVLRKLASGPDIATISVVDTLVLSYLYNPSLEGGHSLEAWGGRLNFPKQSHEDWTQFSHEMLSRCESDVELTERVFLALTAKMRKLGFSELSCEIEHKIRDVVNRQEINGFWFDRQRGEDLLGHLRRRQSDLATEIQALFPPALTPLKEYAFSRLKSGEPSLAYKRHLATYPKLTFRTDEYGNDFYTTWEWKEFNINSPLQRISRLVEHGWIPTKFTPKGTPQADEESLLKYADESGIPAVRAIAETLVLQGRASMVEGWLKCVGPDERIHGRVFTCGADTRRMRHREPNTANIPSDSNKAAYGSECRSLWGVKPLSGRVLLGYDAKGLETRGFCHYLNDPYATELYCSEGADPHSWNAKNLTEGLGYEVIRGGGGAKTLFYAFLYGAGAEKLGKIINRDAKEGARVKAILTETTPGLAKLTRELAYEFRHIGGLLATIDGGFVRCPSQHAALNYKIQSCGTIVMKLAAILLDEEIKFHGWDAKKVGDVHDEGQLDVGKNVATAVGQTAVNCIRLAGQRLAFRVPLDGDYKIGLNWSQTH